MLPPYALIKQGLQNGSVIPFLGAGASLGGRDPRKEPWNPQPPNGLPLGSELSEQLSKTISLQSTPPDLATTAQYYEFQAGRDKLESALDLWLGFKAKIPRVHDYLSKLPGPLVIVTTNYDDLLERAFQRSNHAFDLIAYSNKTESPDSLVFWEHGRDRKEVAANKLTLSFERTVIFKFHGFLSRDPQLDSQYVITEDDYINFLSRMVGTSAIPRALMECFQAHAFLFLGYGLADWNLRLLLSHVSKDRTANTKSWAIQHTVDGFEQPIWQQRDVNLYESSLSDFLDGLENAP